MRGCRALSATYGVCWLGAELWGKIAYDNVTYRWLSSAQLF